MLERPAGAWGVWLPPPHAIQRFAAVPMGLALAWLGYTLWAERRAHAADATPGRVSAPLGRTGADA